MRAQIHIGSQFRIYRDDLKHPHISGNKLHKLKPYFEFAKQQGIRRIISMGGAYSNHLHALAYACKQAKLESIGIIRREKGGPLTPTLKDCQQWGMALHYCPRGSFRNIATKIHEAQLSSEFLDLARLTELEELREIGILSESHSSSHALTAQGSDTLVIGEGGSSVAAIHSIKDAYSEIFADRQYQNITHAVCSIGTGATLAGLRLAAPENVQVIGIQAVAEGDASLKRIQSWIGEPNMLSIIEGHLGGFAKMPKDYLKFIKNFELRNQIPLDPVYNGKVLYQLNQMLAQGYFLETDKVLIIHTGGLQGKR